MSNIDEIEAETIASLHRYTEAMIAKVLAERGLIPPPVEELSAIGANAANLLWNWRRSNLQNVIAQAQLALAALAREAPKTQGSIHVPGPPGPPQDECQSVKTQIESDNIKPGMANVPPALKADWRKILPGCRGKLGDHTVDQLLAIINQAPPPPPR
jgi:hypothetical protein